MVSTATTMVMEFTDRVFLAGHSLEAIAAALPGGIAAFVPISFFLGIASYTGVFIAQYWGAGQEDRVAAALWHGIYFALVAGVILAGLSALGGPLFSLSGHPPEVRRLEALYFRVLMTGAGLHVAAAALSSLDTGLGRTRLVMLVHLAGTLVNIPLDYGLIYGVGGLPELGILGAGLATVAAWGVTALLFALAVFSRKNHCRFGVRRIRRPETELLLRLLRYGVPSAAQFCMDIFAFSVFIFLVGLLGKEAMAVTNIVISINSLAFMPMVGFSLGTSTLVGQALGRGRPEEAAEVVGATLRIILIYTVAMAALFLLAPGPVLGLFRPRGAEGPGFAVIRETGTVLLRFVTVYIFFDAQYMIYIGALKGAGDTRFIMASVAAATVAAMILPLWAGIGFFGMGLRFAWGVVTVFVFTLFVISRHRYRSGGWKGRSLLDGDGSSAATGR